MGLVVSRSERALCLSKYVAGYVRTCPDPCRGRRRRLRLYLYLDLDLNLDLAPHPALNRALFGKPLEKTFERSNPLPFRSSLVLRNRPSLALACLQPLRQTLPPRQSVGRPLHGKTAVPAVPDHYIWTALSRHERSEMVSLSAAARASGIADGVSVISMLLLLRPSYSVISSLQVAR